MAHVWYVLEVIQGLEGRAAEKLRALGLDTYMPVGYHMVFHRRHRRMIRKDFTLFPGYMFVTVPNGQWRSAVEVNGVMGFLGRGDPVPVPGGYIEETKRLEAAGAFDFSVKLAHRFRVGDEVMIDVHGKSVSAKVDGHRGRELIRLLIDFMGKPARKTVHFTELLVA